LPGDGAGGFSADRTFATGASGSIVPGDFNGDGKVDVAATNRIHLRVMYGGGHGTLRNDDGSAGRGLRPAPAGGMLMSMSDVTRILSAIEQGDPHAADQLLPLVYDELRQLAVAKFAQEKAGQTLQPTALVHEAYLRLVDAEQPPHWNSRGHFFAAAAEAMRRILVERARMRRRLKRGGDRQRLDLDALQLAVPEAADELLALEEALVELARKHPDKAELVKLRYFAGLTVAEAAQALGISTSSADRHWAYARAWLYRRIVGDAEL
jgi:RNA polymerase sigma factor (TIGR02999 family)